MCFCSQSSIQAFTADDVELAVFFGTGVGLPFVPSSPGVGHSAPKLIRLTCAAGRDILVLHAVAQEWWIAAIVFVSPPFFLWSAP